MCCTFDRELTGRETGAMVRMNRDRVGGGDDDFAEFGEEPTFAARYSGICATCGQRFSVGDSIASVVVDKKSTYHHAACRYPASAFLAEADGVAHTTAVRPAGGGGCQATTKKGKPCSNDPQKGERFCGPHLTQHRAAQQVDDR